MTNRSQDDSWIGILIFAVVGFIALGVWKFSQSIGVDFATGAEVLYKTIIYLIIFGGASYFLKDTIGIKNTSLALFPFSIFCITPALDFKAMSGIPEFMSTTYVTIPWWGTNLGQFGIFIFLGVISLAIWYFTRDDY